MVGVLPDGAKREIPGEEDRCCYARVCRKYAQFVQNFPDFSRRSVRAQIRNRRKIKGNAAVSAPRYRA